MLHAGNALRLSLSHVILGATLVAGVVLLAGSLMDGVQVNLGLDYYAESMSPLSCAWLPMPFNTVVNVGYIAVGIFWILRVRSLLSRDRLAVDEAYLLYVFAWMILLYGPVQLVRIVTHWRVAGILDQWYTLPIFAWVGVSCRQIAGRTSGKCDVLSVTVSVASYGLAVLYTYGFEVALAAHIVIVVAQAWWVVQRSTASEFHRQRCWTAFIRAVICCIGFVSLKLSDWHLLRMLPIPFALLTGHFWSKVADFMQAHYACQFLEAALCSKTKTVRNKLK